MYCQGGHEVLGLTLKNLNKLVQAYIKLTKTKLLSVLLQQKPYKTIVYYISVVHGHHHIS